jgi:hypothetical protein
MDYFYGQRCPIKDETVLIFVKSRLMLLSLWIRIFSNRSFCFPVATAECCLSIRMQKRLDFVLVFCSFCIKDSIGGAKNQLVSVLVEWRKRQYLSNESIDTFERMFFIGRGEQNENS